MLLNALRNTRFHNNYFNNNSWRIYSIITSGINHGTAEVSFNSLQENNNPFLKKRDLLWVLHKVAKISWTLYVDQIKIMMD